MADYTQDRYFGPPTEGRYEKDDTVTDAASVKWVCTVAGQPGVWDVYQNTAAENAAAVSPLIAAPVDTALPTPDASYRGKLFVVSNTGVGTDTVHVCVDGDGAGTYAWKQITVT